MAAPTAPSALVATVVDDTSIDLDWTDNADDETGFKVSKSLDNLTYVPVITTAADAVTYSVTGLSPSTLYYFKIRATNDDGDSALTTAASATTPSAAPSALVATVVNDTSIDLAWDDNSSDETGFKVSQSEDDISYSPVITTDPDVTSYSVTGLTPSTLYYFKVAATNGDGDSALTTAASATTPPAAPSVLTATVASERHIDLAWTDNATGETGFKVERKIGSGAYIQIATAAANAVSYADTTTHHNQSYTYKVRAYDVNGNSTYATSSAAATSTSATVTVSVALAGLIFKCKATKLSQADGHGNLCKYLSDGTVRLSRRSDNLSSYRTILTVPSTITIDSTTVAPAAAAVIFDATVSGRANDQVHLARKKPGGNVQFNGKNSGNSTVSVLLAMPASVSFTIAS